MPSRDLFWKSINTLRTFEDVDLAWQSHFGETYDRAKPYFAMGADLAVRYPCPTPCGMGCRMKVRNKPSGSFAFCDEEFPQADPVDLEDEDVLVREFSMEWLCRDVCGALDIQVDGGFASVAEGAWSIGTVTLASGTSLPVCLAIPRGRKSYTHVVEKLFLHGRTSYILLVPCGCDDETRNLIEGNNGHVLSLSDIAGGVPGCSEGVRSLASILHAVDYSRDPSYLFERRDGNWITRWDGGAAKVFTEKLLGFWYYRILIDNPYVTFSALDLNRLAKKVVDEPRPGMAIEVADEQALKAYRKKMDDLLYRLEHAEKDNDDAQAPAIKAEIEELEGHIRRVYNVHQRVREESGELQKARRSVSAAMGLAREKLAEKGLEAFAIHLETFAPTGTFMRYHPTHPVRWNA